MDALIEDADQLTNLFYYITVFGFVIQLIFFGVILVHTPKEMTTYKYTMMNCLVWSTLIILQIGILTRPITFLPLPICLITGVVKNLGPFFGGHFQLFLFLFFLVNKATGYSLCLTTHFFAFRFPVFVRNLQLKDAVILFIVFHSAVSGIMIGTAYLSGLFENVVLHESLVEKELFQQQIRLHFPDKYASLQSLINSSLIIGAPRKSVHNLCALAFLVILMSEMIINISTMTYALIFLTRSIQKEKSSSARTFKKRIICMISIRTVVPTLTFGLPAFFGVLVVYLDTNMSAILVQWLLLLILSSPAICCLMTIIGLKQYRRVIWNVARLKISRVIKGYSDSSIEHTSETTTNKQVSFRSRNSIYSMGHQEH